MKGKIIILVFLVIVVIVLAFVFFRRDKTNYLQSANLNQVQAQKGSGFSNTLSAIGGDVAKAFIPGAGIASAANAAGAAAAGAQK